VVRKGETTTPAKRAAKSQSKLLKLAADNPQKTAMIPTTSNSYKLSTNT